MRLFLQNTFATSWCLTHSPDRPATSNPSTLALAFLNTLTFSWIRRSTATRDSCQDLEGCRTDGFLPDGRLFSFTCQIYVKYRSCVVESVHIGLIHAWKVVEGLGAVGGCSPGCLPSGCRSPWILHGKQSQPHAHLLPLLPSWFGCRDDVTFPPETSPYLQGCTAIHHLYLSLLPYRISCPGPTPPGIFRHPRGSIQSSFNP